MAHATAFAAVNQATTIQYQPRPTAVSVDEFLAFQPAIDHSFVSSGQSLQEKPQQQQVETIIPVGSTQESVSILEPALVLLVLFCKHVRLGVFQNEAEQRINCAVFFNRVSKVLVPNYPIVIAAANSLSLDEASFLQLLDDALHGSLCNAYATGNVAEHHL